MTPMQIAVTGATGFIGRRLVLELTSAGHSVRALVRRPIHEGRGLTTVRGSLADRAALQTWAGGANAVVHLAGAVRGVDRTAFDAVNVAGTQAVLDALHTAAPQAHLIHVSTLAAREPHLSDYAGSKRAAEDLVRNSQLAATTILRPTAVYGPGDVELQPLLDSAAKGLATAPGSIDNRVSLIHVDDVIGAILASLAHPGHQEEPFELCDGAPGYRWPEIAATIAGITGKRVRLIAIPRGLLSVAGRMNRISARLIGYAPMLTPGKARELTHPDWSCDVTRFSEHASWMPRFDLTSGLATVLP